MVFDSCVCVSKFNLAKSIQTRHYYLAYMLITVFKNFLLSCKPPAFVVMFAIVRSSPLCTNHVINSKSLEPWITLSGSQTSLDTLANTPLWVNNRALFDIFAVKRPEDVSSLWKLYQELIECYSRQKPQKMSKSPQAFLLSFSLNSSVDYVLKWQVVLKRSSPLYLRELFDIFNISFIFIEIPSLDF